MTRGVKPDLVLVNPGDRARNYQDLGETLAAIENPIWAGLLASFARGRGHRVEIVDANAEGIGPEEAARRVAELDPLICALVVYGHNPSASTTVMPAAGRTLRALRELSPRQLTVMLGGHVAALPEQTLREERPDFVCGGEGFHTLDDLVSWASGRERSELDRVRGLVRLEEGILVRTRPAPLVADLARDVPGHSFDLLPMELYRAHNWHCFGHVRRRKPYAAIYTTLGCPFRCEYCCIQAPFKEGERAVGFNPRANSYRCWSPGAVVAEIETLVEEHGVRDLKIADEMFALKRDHVFGICDAIAERGYDLNIWAYARVDTVDREFLDRMRAGGVRWLCLGIEAANERVRADVQKGYKPEQLARTMQGIEDAGIHVIANYIFGLPEDDEVSMRETLDLALELNCEYANFYCAMAYPGSRLYETARNEGWPLPGDWGGYAQLSRATLPLPTRYVEAEDVLAFRDAAFDEYFTNPSYLEMVARKFGAETRSHVEAMTARPVVRDNLGGIAVAGR